MHRLKGVFPVLEQGSFAAANFLFLLWLGQVLSFDEFGAYVLASASFQLLTAVQHALVIEPMIVSGSSKTGEAQKQYLGDINVRINFIFVMFFTFVICLSGSIMLIFGLNVLGIAFIAISYSTGPTLLFWALRRTCIVLRRPEIAAAATILYASTLLACVPVVEFFFAKSMFAHCVLPAFAAVAAGGFISWRIGFAIAGWKEISADTSRKTHAYHARYGRWALPTEAMHWAATNLPIIALPVWLGLDAVGVYRLIVLMFMPIMQIVAALLNYYLPDLSVKRGRISANKMLIVLVVICGLYFFALYIGFDAIRNVLPKLSSVHGNVAVIYSIAMVFYVVTQLNLTVFRASNAPMKCFYVYVGVTLASASVLPLLNFGLVGVVTSQCVIWGAGMIGSLYLKYR